MFDAEDRARRGQDAAKLLHPRQVSSKGVSGALGANKLQVAERDKSASMSAPSCGWDERSKDFDRGEQGCGSDASPCPRVVRDQSSVLRQRTTRGQNMFLPRTDAGRERPSSQTECQSRTAMKVSRTMRPCRCTKMRRRLLFAWRLGSTPDRLYKLSQDPLGLVFQPAGCTCTVQ